MDVRKIGVDEHARGGCCIFHAFFGLVERDSGAVKVLGVGDGWENRAGEDFVSFGGVSFFEEHLGGRVGRSVGAFDEVCVSEETVGEVRIADLGFFLSGVRRVLMDRNGVRE